jgi:hypothetical protein
MPSPQANGQFDSSTLLSSCPPLTQTQLNNVSTNVSVLLVPFVSGTKKGLLGNYTGGTGVDSNAYMTFSQLTSPDNRARWLETRYGVLLSNSVIPVNPSLSQVANNIESAPNNLEPISSYNREIVAFLELVGQEFCYYQNNYFNALNAYLTYYGRASGQGTAVDNLNEWQSAALTLNQKVNTMVMLINYMGNMNIANIRTLQNQLVSQTSSITRSTESLKEQADILRDNNKTNTLYKEMVDFTEEKNRANKNLLAVYFTLNVVAITCLFIAARTL